MSFLCHFYVSVVALISIKAGATSKNRHQTATITSSFVHHWSVIVSSQGGGT